MVALVPALGGHLALLRALEERLDLGLKVEEGFVAGGVEPPFLDGLADRAAGVLLMAAIGIFALARELGDIFEATAEGELVGPHLDLPHAGVVDEHAAAIERDKLAAGGGVAAFSGGLIDLADPLPVVAVKLVDQGGFPDPARTYDAHRNSRREVGADRLETLALERGGDVDSGIRGKRRDFRSRLFEHFLGKQIRLI